MALRHVLRTHRIAIDWCFEVFDSPDINIKFVGTKEQIADLLTKGFTKGELWDSLLIQAGLVSAAPFSLRANCAAQTFCAFPVAFAMASTPQNAAEGNLRQWSPGPGNRASPKSAEPEYQGQVFFGHEHARFTHICARAAEALAAMLEGGEMMHLLSSATSKDMCAHLSLVMMHMIDQTFRGESANNDQGAGGAESVENLA